MGIGIRLGLTGQRVNASPASLFTVSGSRGFMFDLSDYATQFQDTAGTVPITSTAQSVARVDDLSGLGNHATQATAGSRAATVVFPASGVRNLANGSAAVGDAAYWFASNSSNGITATKTASGVDANGLPYADYSVSGTASAFSNVQVYSTSAGVTAASVGQTYTISVLQSVVGGTAPAALDGVRPYFDGQTAPSTFTEASTPVQTEATVAESTPTSTFTLANAATNQVAARVGIITQSGATVSYTVRIKALQFELGAARTAYQFNYSAQNVTETGFTSIRGIQFDGVDDWLQTAAIDFSNSDEVTVVAGVRKLSDAALGILLELTAHSGTNNSAFLVTAPGGAAANNYTFRSKGTLAADAATVGIYPAPETAVIAGLGKISTDTAILRRNGTQVATSAADQGTGNYANAQVFIGRRGGTLIPYNGVLTFLFAINRLLTANELAMVEAYANARTGAY